jgi:hypothetical protein
MLELDTDRIATGAVSSNGSDTGSGFAPFTTPVPVPVVESVKFSSVLHAVSTTEMINRGKVLDKTGQNNCEIVINALQP